MIKFSVFCFCVLVHFLIFASVAKRHIAKIGTKVVHPQISHPLFYQLKFCSIYKKFYLYWSFTISVIWHRVLTILLQFDLFGECFFSHDAPHLVDIRQRVKILIVVIVKRTL